MNEEIALPRERGLEHLHPDVASWLHLPKPERKHRLLGAKSDWFVTYPAAEKAIARIRTIIEAPPSKRPLNFLLHGESAVGKSQIIRCALRQYPPEELRGRWPLLFVEAPPGLTESSLYNALCEELAVPFAPTERAETKRLRLAATMRTNNVRVVVIDEFQNLLSRPGRWQRELFAAIRHFGNRLGIAFIVAGPTEVMSAIQADPHVASRFRDLHLPRWRRDTAFQKMLAGLEPLLPLAYASNLQQRALAGRLWDLCEGLLGELALLLVDATSAAIDSDQEFIDEKLLRSLDWIAPSKRAVAAREMLNPDHGLVLA